MTDGSLILQGGENYLENVGQEDNVKDVIEVVQAVEGKNMSVAEVEGLRRP